MKKFFTTALAVIALGVSANAANLVVNGDFEADGVVQGVASDWASWWDAEVATVIPGWSTSTAGVWNGYINIQKGEDLAGDGDLRPEEDMAICHICGYFDNGWAKVKLFQVVKGLTVGQTYDLEFLVAVNWPDGSSWTPEQEYGFVIAEPDTKINKDEETGEETTEIVAGREVANVNIAKEDFEVYQDFDGIYSHSFEATAENMYLEFYLANYYGKDNKHDNLWMDVDLITIDDPNAGINNVAVKNTNAPVEYFNLQGVRVANPESGLYIRRQGNDVRKVAL